MGIKGDFRPRYASNSRIFEKRGNPWVTNREGIRDYGRNPDIEDAERDFDQRFHDTGFGPKPAPERAGYHEPVPEREDDPQRRKASIARRMNMRMSARAPRVEVPAQQRHFQPCPGCRSANCINKGICFGALR